MDVQRRSRGSATLPRHTRRHADTPIRRYDSPDTPQRRYADTPIRFPYRVFERARINRATIPVQPV